MANKSSKKVLIITYYWPPAGGPGVQRWLKFVKYLPDFDVEPVVYCPDNPHYPIIDKSLIKEVPKGLKIIKQPIKEPYRLASLLGKETTNTISSGVIQKAQKQSSLQKLMLFIRGNFFIPDARKAWVKPSIRFLSNYLKDDDISTIITTGPPHSVHLIALDLKKKNNLKWIADFRDPWTTIGYHKSLKLTSRSKAKHQHLEQSVLNNADTIVVTSTKTKLEFETKTNKPIKLITNGYDSHNIEVGKKDKSFTLAHIGSLLSERNPEILWQVLSELIKENESFSKFFSLKLIGVVSEEIIVRIKSYGLEGHLDYRGYISHNEAISEQLASQVLLLIEIDSEDTKAIIPGKLFEYLNSKTPILAIGPKQSDVETILQKTKAGSYFYYDQKAELKERILVLFRAFESNTLSVNAIGIESYSRKALTAELAKLL